jgi:hypothetical protein
MNAREVPAAADSQAEFKPEICFCQLLSGERVAAASRPLALYPGSFNPLHEGHRRLRLIAEQRLKTPVHFELSILNVDKPELQAAELERRLQQFIGIAPIWVTRAPRFIDKATLFPGCTFVLGYDTAIRLVEKRYYHADERARDQALQQLLELRCRILVAGRLTADGQFHCWDPAVVARPFQALFLPLSEQEFRADISSTELRQKRSAASVLGTTDDDR